MGSRLGYHWREFLSGWDFGRFRSAGVDYFSFAKSKETRGPRSDAGANLRAAALNIGIRDSGDSVSRGVVSEEFRKCKRDLWVYFWCSHSWE